MLVQTAPCQEPREEPSSLRTWILMGAFNIPVETPPGTLSWPWDTGICVPQGKPQSTVTYAISGIVSRMQRVEKPE